ncbi:hypothetical protein COCSUDRAFT_33311 [Coccomyxa subellipsoidea C-169]|uniref:Uncharacterized protein n=1 Tax=Coccomyxa subellipsoidea (strain C-169) TaxID=574566 RepID=I0YVX0_COCSC|nr:hypothetical protein COCSUDRAFT_33311 [Coccomyxa subellipsoidea C-169]EIE22539.1 hypothetical protein COCSUDRAFT_33311 [Coccomyxa subellipsoidea C-169]|eukprot:XP_005647083.1 hypothetical protein COCSUDRAFT_33311 [Coccomyxa subellipsoidea C-169]
MAHIIIVITRFTCRRQGASADKLHVKAATILPLVGLARSKQDPIIRGHGAQYLYRPPPAGANGTEGWHIAALTMQEIMMH